MENELSPEAEAAIRASIERMADAAHEFTEQYAAKQIDFKTQLENR